MTSADEFKLCTEMHGHSKDVRCLGEAVFPEGRIVSGSRDGTIRVWDKDENSYLEAHHLKGHKGFVSAIVTAAGNVEFPLGRIYSGGQDGTIRMYSSDPPVEMWVMEGHRDTVCSLAFDEEQGQLVSGSWDKTARIWLGRDCLTALEGHEAAVWSVAVVPAETQSRMVSVITGSADKTIKLWVDGKHVRSYTGHTDCVRCVVVLSASQFLSCANDALIRLWDVDSGSVLKTFSGHKNYIYSMAWLAPGHRFITGGEDRSVRVWNLPPVDVPLAQTLMTPAQSVWAVLGLSNGDVACGSSDGVVRVFSCDVSRQAPADIAEVYQSLVNAVADTTKADEELGGIKIADLPGPEALFAPGNKEGQSKMVRQDGKVVLYEWAGSSWKKVGDVMSAKGPAEGKTMHMGKEYDSVIDVDIEDGKPPLKLPYNLSEDPWYAAQRFIDTNSLPMAYLDTIAKYIVANVPGAGKGGVDPAVGQMEAYADPLTGGSRYVPQPAAGSGGSWNAGGDVSDPLTGSGRYVPGSKGPAMPLITNGGESSDPLTGAGRYVPGSAGVAPSAPGTVIDPNKPRSDTLPIRNYEFYCNINNKTIEKLKEFNAKLSESSGNQLTSDQVQCLQSFASAPMVDNTDAKLHNSLIKCFEKGLATWPIDSLIPLLDLFQRSVHQSPVINEHFLRGERGKQLVDQCIQILSKFNKPAVPDESSVPVDSVKSPPPIGVLVAVCRTLGNGFAHQQGELSLSFCGHLLVPGIVSTAFRSERALAHSAGVIVIENLCFCEFSHGTGAGRLTLLKTLVESLIPVIDAKDGGQRWSEDISTGLVRCIGTLLWGSEQVIQAGKVIPKTGWLVTRLKDRLTVEQAKHDARCVERMLGML